MPRSFVPLLLVASILALGAAAPDAVTPPMDTPDVQLAIFRNPTLDRHLHVAINAEPTVGSVSLTINGDPVALTQQGDGSWFGSYVLDANGEMDVVLITDAGPATRRFEAAHVGAGATTITSTDGVARLGILCPAAARPQGAR